MTTPSSRFFPNSDCEAEGAEIVRLPFRERRDEPPEAKYPGRGVLICAGFVLVFWSLVFAVAY